MSNYVAVLGRQPLISVAELEAQFADVRLLSPTLATFTSADIPNIHRLGGTIKIATPVANLDAFFRSLPGSGKITLGLSDFSKGSSARSVTRDALALKRQLVKLGHSVRLVPNQTAILSGATTFHNRLFTATKIELLKLSNQYYRVISVSNLEAYVRRDRNRPARDARVGMLPPKLAQILINLCGPLAPGSRLLDPFCGTGVLLQEATLSGLTPYGTDISPRMVDYTERNLKWLATSNGHDACREKSLTPTLAIGDATSFRWDMPIDAVACETYLGPPLSHPPSDIKLREIKQECSAIILGFLKNLAPQIDPGTPVTIAVPAWLRPDGTYSRLNLLDLIPSLRYNVYSFKNLGQKDLLYHRDKQVVAREIIVLRKI